jgi:hypothetical protein
MNRPLIVEEDEEEKKSEGSYQANTCHCQKRPQILIVDDNIFNIVTA